ncbi:MAG: ATP-binding cassette domain-containing protein [Clostridia bacterium]|nr:ATP-binding cassette domain-containing protein [Clostridia bacterium]
MISIQNVRKVFSVKSGTVTALKDISLDVNAGEIFGIIGLSGAGKSTLVRCMNLLERPTEGSVLFEGKNLMDLSQAELNATRKSISMIFQQFNLLMQRTALKNVCFPLELIGMKKKEAEARAAELLKLVELEDRINSYPSQLSGGQKQRVAIARALATNPKVLLCDEATSALDPKTTRAILTLLRDINKKLGITIIIITHEMSVIQQICHRVAIIDGGVIAESGEVEKIFANPQTEAAKKLVFPDGRKTERVTGKRMVRIVFDGRSSFEPIVANMVLSCQAPVNIMFANTQDIEGQAVGQMVIQLPDDEEKVKLVMDYLKQARVNAQEVSEIG